MKTKFLPKLLLLTMLALFLHSCTADEQTPNQSQNADDTSTTLDGQPLIISVPKK